jgi:hypothetical protein
LAFLPSSRQVVLKASHGGLLMTFILLPINSVLNLGTKRGNEECKVGMQIKKNIGLSSNI